MTNSPKDMFGRPLEVGQLVVKAKVLGRSGKLEIREVIRIEGTKAWLNGVKPVALDFPERLMILEGAHEAYLAD